MNLPPPLNRRLADLPLPDPYPEYLVCPHCGEPEVEVWCYQREAICHHCGGRIPHTPAPCLGCSPLCRSLT